MAITSIIDPEYRYGDYSEVIISLLSEYDPFALGKDLLTNPYHVESAFQFYLANIYLTRRTIQLSKDLLVQLNGNSNRPYVDKKHHKMYHQYHTMVCDKIARYDMFMELLKERTDANEFSNYEQEMIEKMVQTESFHMDSKIMLALKTSATEKLRQTFGQYSQYEIYMDYKEAEVTVKFHQLMVYLYGQCLNRKIKNPMDYVPLTQSVVAFVKYRNRHK